MNELTACDLWEEEQKMQKDAAHRPLRKAK
jgi:hypothetical protein